ncbi:MAG: hypothetical protein WBA28_02390, partial [Microbacteriaceae bacterium]
MTAYEEQVGQLADQLFPKLDESPWTLDEPMLWESFGELLVPQLKDLGIERIISWDQLHSTVLAHVLARSLGAKVANAYAEDGLLGIDRAGAGEEVAIILDIDWPAHPPASALFSYAESQG